MGGVLRLWNWGRRLVGRTVLTVFISHTSELRQQPVERSFVSAARDAVVRAHHAVSDMGYFTARDSSAAHYCISEVEAADVYVGIIGVQYGTPVTDRPEYSYTELEFETASQLRIPRLVFLVDEDAAPRSAAEQPKSQELAERQAEFRRRLADGRMTIARVRTPAQLELLLYHALIDLRRWPLRRLIAGTTVIALLIGLVAVARLGPLLVSPVTTPSITVLSLRDPDANPVGIAAGQDAFIWFTELNANRIGRVKPGGGIEDIPLPQPSSEPLLIAAGPDHDMWFTERAGNRIGKISSTMAPTEYPIPTDNSMPGDITLGPDGNLWFTERAGNRIARITPAGLVTEFELPTPASQPDSICVGPDGNLWITEAAAGQIARVTTLGHVTEFPVPSRDSQPTGLTRGSDGAIWFSEMTGDRIGRITTSGAVSEIVQLPVRGTHPLGIVTGPDGGLWFAERGGAGLGHISRGRLFSELVLPGGGARLVGPIRVALAPNGDLWVTEADAAQIVRVPRSMLG